MAAGIAETMNVRRQPISGATKAGCAAGARGPRLLAGGARREPHALPLSHHAPLALELVQQRTQAAQRRRREAEAAQQRFRRGGRPAAAAERCQDTLACEGLPGALRRPAACGTPSLGPGPPASVHGREH